MGTRDEMFRAKVLLFMLPLVLPIGQPPARATDQVAPQSIECVTPHDDADLGVQTPTLSLPDRDQADDATS
ncbi:MAG: hypothetical protein AAGH99_12905 [Planctomycetota bacterium]